MDMPAGPNRAACGVGQRSRLFSILSLVQRVWSARWRRRQALFDLDDHLLRDIGRTREEARREAKKRFCE